MAIIDVRQEESESTDTIVFSDKYSGGGFNIGNRLTKHPDSDYVRLSDNLEYVLISNAEHAENLIKALRKAIDLGWLK